MKSQRVKISAEEYLQMQHPFGYKVEYFNGEVHFKPQELFIDGHLILKPKKTTPEHSYQPVKTTDQQPLKETFFEAFQDAIEFSDCPEHALREHAEKNIDRYFAGVRGKPSPSSKLWRDQNGKIAGLALFITTHKGETKLDLLCVLPECQRQGIATEMVSLATDELLQQGITKIYSTWHVLNQTSQDWHHHFGFTDVYDPYFIRLKLDWSRREIHRLQAHGLSDGLEALQQQRSYWHSLLDEEW